MKTLKRNLIYEGKEIPFYQVDAEGNVYSETGKLMTKIPTHDGYDRVKLSRGLPRKMYHVHRLVASTFIDNPNGLPIVHHKNSIRNDNRVENLEWCDNSHNQKERFTNSLGTRAKPVKMIDPQTGDVLKVFDSPLLAEKETGIARQNISKVARGLRNQAGGYYWQY